MSLSRTDVTYIAFIAIVMIFYLCIIWVDIGNQFEKLEKQNTEIIKLLEE